MNLRAFTLWEELLSILLFVVAHLRVYHVSTPPTHLFVFSYIKYFQLVFKSSLYSCSVNSCNFGVPLGGGKLRVSVFYHLGCNSPILATSSSIKYLQYFNCILFCFTCEFVKYFIYVSVNKLCSQVDCD